MRYPVLKTIRAKVLVWLAIVVLPVIAAGVFSLNFIHNKLSERIDLDLLNASRLESARIRDTLNSYRLSVESLVSRPLVSSFTMDAPLPNRIEWAASALKRSGRYSPETVLPLDALSEQMLENAAFAGSEITNIMLVDKNLTVLGSTRDFSWQPYDADIVNATLGANRTRFGNAFIGADGSPQLGIVTPIAKRDRVVGAAIFELRLGPVVDLVEQHEGFGETSEAHIAQPTRDGDAQFITLMRFARQAAFNKIVPKSRDLPINWSLRSENRHIVRSPDYRAIPSILALQTIPETGWGLVVKIDEAEAMQPVIEIQRISLLASVVLVLFVGLFFILHLMPLTRRLSTTAIAAERIAEGNYSNVISDHCHDELGKVNRSIDRMSRALKVETRQRQNFERRIRYQATHDALTGLHNRGSIVELLEKLDKLAADKPHTIIFLDLDGFKPVNDHYGHAAGDGVLKEVGSRLMRSVGKRAVVGRWGGDEFVVVLPNRDLDGAQQYLEKIEAAFQPAMVVDGIAHDISCSAGMACNERQRSLALTLELADSLMYRQKEQCRVADLPRAA